MQQKRVKLYNQYVCKPQQLQFWKKDYRMLFKLSESKNNSYWLNPKPGKFSRRSFSYLTLQDVYVRVLLFWLFIELLRVL